MNRTHVISISAGHCPSTAGLIWSHLISSHPKSPDFTSSQNTWPDSLLHIIASSSRLIFYYLISSKLTSLLMAKDKQKSHLIWLGRFTSMQAAIAAPESGFVTSSEIQPLQDGKYLWNTISKWYMSYIFQGRMTDRNQSGTLFTLFPCWLLCLRKSPRTTNSLSTMFKIWIVRAKTSSTISKQ